MEKLQQRRTGVGLSVLLSLLIGLGAVSLPETVSAAGYSHSTCAGEGCTHLDAVRSGRQVTVQVHGFSYVPGHKVWVQINIEVAATGQLLYRDMGLYTVRSDGRTPVKYAFADCGVTVLIQAWTWKAYSNIQPGVSVYM